MFDDDNSSDFNPYNNGSAARWAANGNLERTLSSRIRQPFRSVPIVHVIVKV